MPSPSRSPLRVAFLLLFLPSRVPVMGCLIVSFFAVRLHVLSGPACFPSTSCGRTRRGRVQPPSLLASMFDAAAEVAPSLWRHLPFFLYEAQTKALVRFVLSGIIFAFNTQCICSISALWLELHDSNACALAGQLCSRGRIWSAVCKMYVCMLYALVVGTFVGGWLMLTLCVHARLEVQRKGEERKKLQRGKRKRRSDGEGTGDFLLSLV